MASPVILAIDPGPVRSAWIGYQASSLTLRGFGIWDNQRLLESLIASRRRPLGAVVIEKVEGYGMAVGAEVFETVFWAGRFAQAVFPLPFERLGRKPVKRHLCGTDRAKDPNVRQALIDRFGGPDSIRKGGPLFGVSKDTWAALAVAVAFGDGVR